MAYQGYANYQTWNVNLWLDNDEPLYRQKQAFIRRDSINADSVEEFCRECFPNGTPDMKGRPDMGKVDYEELATEWQSEYDEAYGETEEAA